jgi:hypothetical protein
MNGTATPLTIEKEVKGRRQLDVVSKEAAEDEHDAGAEDDGVDPLFFLAREAGPDEGEDLVDDDWHRHSKADHERDAEEGRPVLERLGKDEVEVIDLALSRLLEPAQHPACNRVERDDHAEQQRAAGNHDAVTQLAQVLEDG